jgi:preprotein translocase subunit SecG
LNKRFGIWPSKKGNEIMSWESWLAYGSMGLLMLVGILLMIVILLQRGRGGGLAGAFGGAGGQSAFGTRAGDVFTKITAIMAFIWISLAGVSRFALEPAATREATNLPSQEELDANRTPSATSSGASDDEGEAESPRTPPNTERKTPRTPPNTEGEAEPETNGTPNTEAEEAPTDPKAPGN